MSFLPGNQETRLTSTTPVAVIAAPAAGVIRLVKEIIVINDDSTDHDIRARLTGTDLGTVDFSTKKILKDTSGNLMDDTAVIVLDTTGQTIELYTKVAISATNPVASVMYADFTPVDVTPFIVRWDTNTDFNKGILFQSEVVGTGNAAYVQMAAFADNDDDITYTVEANYTLSSGTDLEVTAGQARLKALTGTSEDWPFTTPANYTYPAEIEVTGGVAQLVDQRPADATFYCNYTSKDGNWGDGVLTGTLNGGATVTSGHLNVFGASGRSCEYAYLNNGDVLQTGTARWGYVPQYTGTPGDFQVMFTIGTNATFADSIYVYHGTDDKIFLVMYNASSVLIMAQDLGTWSPTAGVEYEFEFDWNISTGASRLFIDGVQKGSTATQTGTHTAFNIIRVGNNYANGLTSDFKINYFALFSTVQHTAGYTPAGQGGLPATIYDTTDPVIYNNTGFVFASPLGSFVADDVSTGGALGFQMSSDGTIYKWWNGAAWEERSSTIKQETASAIATSVGTPTGSITDIQALDANLYLVQEVTGAPGFTTQIDWTSLPDQTTQVTLYANYIGAGGHTVNVDFWNWILLQWDNAGTIPGPSGGITQYNFAIPGSLSTYTAGGATRIRINHTSPGNPSHQLQIDYAYALQNANPTSAWWYANESNTEADVNTNIGTLAGSGTASWAMFVHSNDGSQTPITTNINIGESITYSTTDNLYLDTKAASQIAPTNIVSWLTALVSATIPANTDVKLLISTDGRTTWQKWTGAAWGVEAAPTLRANGMTIAQLETNFPTLPLGSGTLDVRLFLYSSVNTVRPAVGNFNATSDAGFPATSSFETNEYDSGNIGQDWGEVNFTVTIPGGTTLTVKTRAGDVSGALGAYGSALTDGDDAGVTGQIIQFLVDFTSSGSNNPNLDRVQCAYVTPIVTEVAP